MHSVHRIGVVESALRDPAKAPKQAHEGAPSAWLQFDEAYSKGLRDIRVGDAILVITWLDRADRTTLEVHPRDDLTAPLRGVFSTRSADRPNPIGLHRVKVVEIVSENFGPKRIRVDALEAIDGTAILDVKPVLDSALER